MKRRVIFLLSWTI